MGLLADRNGMQPPALSSARLRMMASTTEGRDAVSLVSLESMGVSLVNFEDNPAVCQAEFVLPEHAATFRDHFPGRPLLPAIGLISLCDWMIGRWLGDAVGLASLKRVRFTLPIVPEMRLEIQLTRRGGDRLRMVARSAAGEHTSGELGLHLGTAMDDDPRAEKKTA
jgi:hypothetical protein